ncbi:L-seryl-tRNA(Sec) selenium transferase [Citricoccus muralis]|uniref:L-seryl-tRNA(Sec) selenium transferase n=1 Tax=Citricoccus muralis TaxID=169134 RepID=A0ABY8H7K1_9MICC|nr:L-seryl-tRNA(Sec) selenium transferase [Citricoccus muralis]WFP16638.1 L-seryl-tRNA(Sec) selenium transferase [Citricoccus muralis]
MHHDGDRRRAIPRTDDLLALDVVDQARQRLAETEIRAVLRAVQERARTGQLPPEQVRAAVAEELLAHPVVSLAPVLNATGVIVHTNLGRAPLSAAAREAVQVAAGYVDVEMDLGTGKRSSRATGTAEALLRACPQAEDALVVNNGAAALLLAITALCAGPGSSREAVVSRGELVEIGAGFRLPDLMVSTGARLREVGTTNRTHLEDYRRALGPDTGCLVKVHPSNFRVEGFTSDVGIPALRTLADAHGLPLVVDLGSGLLAPDPSLPQEPDIATALRAGADVVIASGDKLLGGPQAGILLGRVELIQRLRTHPLARALRADKLALAALEATLRGPEAPVPAFLHADPEHLHARTAALADAVGGTVVEHHGRVGGGGAPGHPLPGWAVELPESVATALRQGSPAVLARAHSGRCLIDLRCIPEHDDAALTTAVRAALTVTTIGS